MNDWINITVSGEITYNPNTRIYTIWDESYAHMVYTTRNKNLAFAVFHDYQSQLEEQEEK